MKTDWKNPTQVCFIENGYINDFYNRTTNGFGGVKSEYLEEVEQTLWIVCSTVAGLCSLTKGMSIVGNSQGNCKTIRRLTEKYIYDAKSSEKLKYGCGITSNMFLFYKSFFELLSQ